MTFEREREIREWVERWNDAPEWAEWQFTSNGRIHWSGRTPHRLTDEQEQTLERRPDPVIAELLEALSELRDGVLGLADEWKADYDYEEDSGTTLDAVRRGANKCAKQLRVLVGKEES